MRSPSSLRRPGRLGPGPRLAWVVALAVGFSWATPQIDVAEVVGRVAVNVEAKADSLPDFVCREKVSQQSWYDRGAQRGNSSAVFEFRVSGQFGEERFSANEEDQALADQLIILGGAFSVFYDVFGHGRGKKWDFKLQRKKKTYKLSLEVPAAESHSLLNLPRQGHLRIGYKADFVVDSESCQPVRMKRELTDLPEPLKYVEHEVVYAPVQFGDETFYLPKKQTILVKYGNIWYRAQHSYDDYKRFTVDLK